MGAMSMPSGIVTCLPDVDVEELVPVVEVLVQEHLTTFAAPVRALPTLRALFRSRAVFGAWQVGEFEELRQAHDAGATFVLADRVDRDMAAYCEADGPTLLGSAMTPTEARAVLALGAAGVLFWPADVVGHVMAGHLERLGLTERVVPMGGVGAFAAGEWLKHGSPAACVDATLLGDAVDGGDLGLLRERCESFRQANRRAVAYLGRED